MAGLILPSTPPSNSTKSINTDAPVEIVVTLQRTRKGWLQLEAGGQVSNRFLASIMKLKSPLAYYDCELVKADFCKEMGIPEDTPVEDMSPAARGLLAEKADLKEVHTKDLLDFNVNLANVEVDPSIFDDSFGVPFEDDGFGYKLSKGLKYLYQRTGIGTVRLVLLVSPIIAAMTTITTNSGDISQSVILDVIKVLSVKKSVVAMSGMVSAGTASAQAATNRRKALRERIAGGGRRISNGNTAPVGGTTVTANAAVDEDELDLAELEASAV